MESLSKLVNSADYEKAAEIHFSKTDSAHNWRYISGVSGDGITYQDNLNDFDKIKLAPSVLHGCVLPDLTHTFLGNKVNTPLLLAPIAYQKVAHESGELGAIQAAMAQDVGFCLSTLSSTPLEHIAEYHEQNNPLIFQLYLQAKQTVNLDLIKRASVSGYQAIMITVDAPINGLRYHEARDKFSLPDSVKAENLTCYESYQYSGLSNDNAIAQLMSNAPCWQDISKIINESPLPVFLKGILSVNDAIKAKKLGVHGIVVSNHGGRILDGVPSSINQLPSIRQAVGPNFSLVLDSGIRRGSDIYKALASGADAVMIGRPFIYALNVAGPLGVAHLLRLLKDELLVTMALMGNHKIEQITKDQLITR